MKINNSLIISIVLSSTLFTCNGCNEQSIPYDRENPTEIPKNKIELEIDNNNDVQNKINEFIAKLNKNSNGNVYTLLDTVDPKTLNDDDKYLQFSVKKTTSNSINKYETYITPINWDIHKILDHEPVIKLIGGNSLKVDFGSNFQDPGYTATDDEDGNITSNVIVTGKVNTFKSGNYSLLYTVTDSDNNTNIVTRNIVVGSNQIEKIKLDISNDNEVNSKIQEYVNKLNNNLDKNVYFLNNIDESWKITRNPIKFSINVTNLNGNSYTLIKTIDIDWDNPPKIELSQPINYTLKYGENYIEPGYSASDIEDGNITSNVITKGLENINNLVPGKYTIEYDVSDSKNQSVNKFRIVNVLENKSEFIDLNISHDFEVNTKINAYINRLNDNDNGETYTLKSISDWKNSNKIILTINKKENELNYDIIKIINIDWDRSPTITLIGDQHINLKYGENYIEPGYSASDVEDGDISSKVVVNGLPIDPTDTSLQKLKYIVTDSHNNSSEVTREIQVSNNEVVDISLNISNDKEVESKINEFIDKLNEDSDDGKTYTLKSISDWSPLDTQFIDILVEVNDNKGYKYQKIYRNIINWDRTPTITLIGDQHINLKYGENYIEPGVIAIDKEDGDISSKIIKNGFVNSSKSGEYILKYSIVDSVKNYNFVERKITVSNEEWEQPNEEKINNFKSLLEKCSLSESTFDSYNMENGEFNGDLNLSNCNLEDSDLEHLNIITSIKTLNLSNNNITSLSNLKFLNYVDTLNLNDNNINDFSMIQKIDTINNLYLSNNNITSLDFLEGKTHFNKLDLSFNKLKNINELKNISVTDTLDLSDNFLEDISGLSNLVTIKKLNLLDNNLTSVYSLSNLKNIDMLGLDNNNLDNLDGLENITIIKLLSANNNNIQDISGIKNINYIDNLYLNNNKISDIRWLNKIKSIYTLSLSNNLINDLSGISSLVNVDNLILSNNNIVNLKGLEGLEYVKNIYLDNNHIDNLNGLINLKKVQNDLNLENNELFNLNGLYHLKEVGTLNLFNNNNLVNFDAIAELEKVNNYIIIPKNEGFEGNISNSKSLCQIPDEKWNYTENGYDNLLHKNDICTN